MFYAFLFKYRKFVNNIVSQKSITMKNIFLFIATASTLFLAFSVTAQNPNKKAEAELFASSEHSVGNIAFTPEGNLVYSYHPFFSPRYRVVKYDVKTKKIEPFPNEEWNTPSETHDYFLSSVLGIRNDSNGIVWMLDMGHRNNVTPKIVGWNTWTNRLEKIYYIPAPATLPTSQHNDMVVDEDHGVFIIADEGIANGGDGSQAGIVTVDMKSGKVRRLLTGHRTTIPESQPTVVAEKTLFSGKAPLLVGADGITADKNNEWLYYAPLNGTKIYRVKIENLINEKLSEGELDKRIEIYSSKPNNGGLSIDKSNNLYLTAVESNSISVVLAEDKSVQTLVQNENMLWPDGVSYNSADGYMYVSASQIHLGDIFNNGVDKTTQPFYIFRFKPISKGITGR
ncbi:MAG: Major royal jelly protein [Candidatus Brocadia fulgida]|uniref:Major royal jelly protein n=1 Tax=Candidatus Brocadia fulgida TaxID=380242 RepID=A0A0M2UYI9_9BACT|nr:MAG: Major royal jelly protein [Candidatus Brocadia fulgida]